MQGCRAGGRALVFDVDHYFGSVTKRRSAVREASEVEVKVNRTEAEASPGKNWPATNLLLTELVPGTDRKRCSTPTGNNRNMSIVTRRCVRALGVRTQESWET